MFGRKRDTSEKTEKPKFSKESFKEGLKAFQFIKPYKWHFIGGMVLLFASSLLFMIFPYLIGQLMDAAAGKANFGLTIPQIGWILIIALPIQGLVGYFRVILFAIVSEKGTADIRKNLYQKMISLPITFFEENKTGDLLSRVTSDVDKLFSVFSITLAEFIRQILTLIVGILFLAITMPQLSLIMILTIPVVVVFGFFFGKYIRKFSKSRQEKLAESNSMLSESLHSISIVKSFANEWFEIKRYYDSIKEVVGIGLKYAGARALFSVFIVTIFFGAIFFIIWQGVLIGSGGNDFKW